MNNEIFKLEIKQRPSSLASTEKLISIIIQETNKLIQNKGEVWPYLCKAVQKNCSFTQLHIFQSIQSILLYYGTRKVGEVVQHFCS